MEVLLALTIALTLIVMLVFFLWQITEHGRSPIGVFFSLLKRKEFKVLLSYVENGQIKQQEQGRDVLYLIDNGNFVFKKSFYNDRWKLNNTRLSYFQERALLKTINRRKLNVHLLTKNAQLLYSKD